MQIVDLAHFKLVECRKDGKKFVELQKIKAIVDVELVEINLQNVDF